MKRIRWFLILLLARRVPTCEVMTERASRVLDRKPPLIERITSWLHLRICVWCTRYHQQVAFASNAVRQDAIMAEQQDKPRQHLSDEARIRLKESIRKNR